MTELEVMAKTLFGEARGEGIQGMEAVACVIVNRVKQPGWWGKTIKEVCLKPFQFSCWNASDPNYNLLQKDLSGDVNYCVCTRIAQKAIDGILPDITDGATHYHTKSINPKWAKGKVPCAEVGNHLFYKDIE